MVTRKSYEEIAAQFRIGDTDLVQLPAPGTNNRIFAKLEYQNHTGSHYDRVYLLLLRYLEDEGKIDPRITTLVETTSGNSGISCAWMSKMRGYQGCVIFTPERFRPRCIELIAEYGADIREVSGSNGIADAAQDMKDFLISHARDKVGKMRKYFSPNHSQTDISCDALSPIATEADAQAGFQFTCFVGAAGNGCTLRGIGEKLREINPSIRILAFEPARARVAHHLKSPCGLKQPYRLHTLFGTGGWGITFPNLEYAVQNLVDEIVPVEEGSWVEIQNTLKELGYSVGNTSAVSYQLACDYCQDRLNQEVLIAFYDSADHY